MGVNTTQTTGVLLMAYGSPDSLDQMEAYLLDVRGGRPTPPSLVEEIQHRYAQIGGRSPLLDITRRQAAALEAELNRRNAGDGTRYRAYVGMRHWEPRIAEAVAQIAADGVEKLVALVMAPHSSRMSSGAYFARLDEAMAEAVAEQGAQLRVTRIPSWHDHPGLIDAITQHACDALENFGDQEPYILFTAHSLPSRILAQGDPYDAQLRETAVLVAKEMNWPLGRFQFCYQSAGQSGEQWMGPPIEQVVVQLADLGEKNILVVPVGFVCDHVEVLYDIDIVARGLAASHGARLERSASLNDSPVFIRALADLVESHANSAVD
jgi:ferrochelatase